MLEAKIKNVKQLKKIIAWLKAKGKRIVFTNGCFDLLHYGHIKYLQDAKRKGDILIVAINSDASVKKIKGPKRPILKEKYRLKAIAGLESVDYVLLFNEETPFKVINILKPDILVKGADWKKDDIVGSDLVLKRGGRVFSVKLVKGLSTTNLIKKIVRIF